MNYFVLQHLREPDEQKQHSVTNLKDIVKQHKPSAKKVINNYNITVNGDLNVDQMIGKQQK